MRTIYEKYMALSIDKGLLCLDHGDVYLNLSLSLLKFTTEMMRTDKFQFIGQTTTFINYR